MSQMEESRQQFMRSEAASLMTYYGRSDHPELPPWITDEQRQQFDALSESERAKIREMRAKPLK